MLRFIETLKGSAPATIATIIITIVVAGVVTLIAGYTLLYVFYLRKKNGKLKKEQPKPDKLDLNEIMGYDFIKIIYPDSEEKKKETKSFADSVGIGMTPTGVNAEPLVNNDADPSFQEQYEEPQRRPDPIEAMNGKQIAFSQDRPEEEQPESQEPADNENIIYGEDATEMNDIYWNEKDDAELMNGDPLFDNFMDNMSENNDDDKPLESVNEEKDRQEQEAYEGLMQKMKENHDQNLENDKDYLAVMNTIED